MIVSHVTFDIVIVSPIFCNTNFQKTTNVRHQWHWPYVVNCGIRLNGVVASWS
jgi:hypothetical protein